VSIFVLYDQVTKEIVLQKRDKGAPTLAGFWSFFGGGIEEDESPIETVLREAKEELGINLQSVEMIGRYEIEQDNGLNEKYVFVAPLKNTIEELKRMQMEGESLGKFTLDEIRHLHFPRFNLPIIESIKEYFEKTKN
jgi:8-oxo-dGTP diphosphatase